MINISAWYFRVEVKILWYGNFFFFGLEGDVLQFCGILSSVLS